MSVIRIDPKDIGATPADPMPETPDLPPQQPADAAAAVDAAQPGTVAASEAGQPESLTDFIERLRPDHGATTMLAPPVPAPTWESPMMQLWSRMEPELALITGGKRVASGAEIIESLRNNARGLGIALQADGADVPPGRARHEPAPGSDASLPTGADDTQPGVQAATDGQAGKGPAGAAAAGTPAAPPGAPVAGLAPAGGKGAGQADAAPAAAGQVKPGDPAATDIAAAPANGTTPPPGATAPASTPGAAAAAATPAAPAINEMGKSGFAAVISGNTMSDPQLAPLIQAKRAYDTARLEQTYKHIMSDIRDKNKELIKQQGKKGHEKRVLALQARLAQRTSDAQAAAAALLPALQAQRPLEQYFIGKNVNILVGTPSTAHREAVFDNNGRAQFARGVTASTYTIKGPNYKFATADDAAFDAIALARGVAGSLGENNERTGYIIKRADGTFGYEYPYRLSGVGTPFPRLYASGADFQDQADPPPPNAVAIWHIHPIGNADENVKNVYFGPGDIKAPWIAAKGIGALKFDAYLGGSDGGVRVVRDIRSYREKLDGTRVAHKRYQQIGLGYLLLR